MPLILENWTDFRDDHLEALIDSIRAVELPDADCPDFYVEVRFDPKGHSSYGKCFEFEAVMQLWLPRAGRPDKVRFAHTIAHECAHAAGLDHNMMGGDPRYDEDAPGWREIYAWADSQPLERRELGEGDEFLKAEIARFDEAERQRAAEGELDLPDSV